MPLGIQTDRDAAVTDKKHRLSQQMLSGIHGHTPWLSRDVGSIEIDQNDLILAGPFAFRMPHTRGPSGILADKQRVTVHA